jgi:hypothetical protein
VAVIGLGRTPTLKLAWPELVELTWDGEVVLLLHAIDPASMTAVTPARRNFVKSPPGPLGSHRRMCEVDAAPHRVNF